MNVTFNYLLKKREQTQSVVDVFIPNSGWVEFDFIFVYSVAKHKYKIGNHCLTRI